jgi:hypothetical protein
MAMSDVNAGGITGEIERGDSGGSPVIPFLAVPIDDSSQIVLQTVRSECLAGAG